MPEGISSLRSNPGSVVYSQTVFSCREMAISTTSCRRSARFRAAFRKLTSESDAVESRMLSRPEEMAGKEMAARIAMIATTTTISTSVTPETRERLPHPAIALLVFPTDNIGIQTIASGLAVGAVRDHIRLVAVFPGILVHVWAAPGVERNLFGQIWTRPLVYIVGPGAQRL